MDSGYFQKNILAIRIGIAIIQSPMALWLSQRQYKGIAALLIATLFNLTFIEKLRDLYPGDVQSIGFIIAVVLIHSIVIYNIISLASLNTYIKSITLMLLFFSGLVTYQTIKFGTVIDRTMILNILNTDRQEIFDLLSKSTLLFMGFMAIFCGVIARFINIPKVTVARRITVLCIDAVISIALILALAVPFNKQMASFLREHKPVRFYAVPTFSIYSIVSFILEKSGPRTQSVQAIGLDGQIAPNDTKRDLVIFVLGETARAQNFSLNGYQRETNPRLKKQDVISLTNLFSCGTSTAVSVPCMFSIFGRDGYTHEKAESTYNLVDVLYQTKNVDVLWRDNNSNSKGVAVRVPYEDFKTPKRNPVCDIECRDIGMLDGLQKFIDQSQKRDILIVLHQMGNHGPAYYKRYPKEFEKFKPACQSNELSTCTNVEIVNAYDNAILYTDYFLNELIELLKKNEPKFEAALFYVSDHGESLGENGVYLHGLPYAIAPDEQKHVGALIWMSPTMSQDHDLRALRANAHAQLTHDDVFHTLLGFFEIETTIYDKSKDILQPKK